MIIPYFAKLDRGERIELAQRFLDHAALCNNQPASFAGMVFRNHEEGYVVLASTQSRTERQIALCNVGMAFAFRHKLRKVIGLSGAPEQSEFSAKEAMVLDTSNLEDTSALRLMALELFGPLDQSPESE